MKAITNTFVLIAPDSPTRKAVVPQPRGGSPTVPMIQHQLLTQRPYQLTLEDLIFETHIRREGLSAAAAKKQEKAIRAQLFAKPHPCMRAAALAKTYGWGVHHDSAGRIALHAAESPEYAHLASGKVKEVEVVAAMRSKRDD